MPYRILHKKNNTVLQNAPKSPDANDLMYGEIAVNYAEGYESLFLKNDNNDIVGFSSDESFIEKNTSRFLPTITASDEGKILKIVNGVWTLVSPSTLYTGSGTPSSEQGNNGDLYLETS